MRHLYHPQSLAQELRPLAAAVSLVLISFALIACGSSEQAAAAPDLAQPAAAQEQGHASPTHPAENAEHPVGPLAEHADHAATHPAEHSAHPVALPAGELPGSSIYHLGTPWTDHQGQAFSLPGLRGGPAVFVMFYGDCTTACPLLVKSAEDIAEALSEEQRAITKFVMVTFDTDRDTPEKLAAYAADKGLDGPNWHWLVGSALQTRQLATLLGVQYRDAGNGMFAHSNVVTVLDRHGVPTARLEGLGIDLGPAVAAVAQAARP